MLSGEVGYDSTNSNWHVFANSVDNFVALFPSASPPATGDLVKFVKTGSTWTLVDAGIAPASWITSISIVTANGLQGSSSGGTTPALTLGPDSSHVIPVNTGSSIQYLTGAGTYHQPSAADLSNGANGSGQVALVNGPTFSNPQTNTPAAGDYSNLIPTTQWVANAILGQNFKAAAQWATTANLTATYSNGSAGVGATLTETAIGALTVDAILPAVGDRILVKNQTTTYQNGIYTVTTAGSVSVVYVLTRATDFNTPGDINTGDSLYVLGGTTNAGTTWAYNGVSPPTIGTTALTFAQTAGPGTYMAGNGLTLSGLTFQIDTTITADLTSTQSLINKTVNGVTLSTTAGSSVVLYGNGSYGAITCSIVSGAPCLSTANIFTNPNTFQAVTLAATGTATSGTNYASNLLTLDYSYWNGSSATAGACALSTSVGDLTTSQSITIFNCGGFGSLINYFSVPGLRIGNSAATNYLLAIGNGSSSPYVYVTQAGALTVTGTFVATGLVTNADLANSTISGVSLGSNLNALTFGTHLTGTSYNGSTAVTIATDATSANTNSTIMARDSSGNFAASTATLTNISMASAGKLSWNSDVGFSRVGINQLALGNGTSSDNSGSLLLGNEYFGCIAGSCSAGNYLFINSNSIGAVNGSSVSNWSITNSTGAAQFGSIYGTSITSSGNMSVGGSSIPNWSGNPVLVFDQSSSYPMYPFVASTNNDDVLTLGVNAYISGGSYYYQNPTGFGSFKEDIGYNGIIFYSAPAGTGAITYTRQASIDYNGFEGAIGQGTAYAGSFTNVGIGTSSPNQALMVSGFASSGYGTTVQIVGTASYAGAQDQVNITPTANNWGMILGADNAGVTTSGYHAPLGAFVVNVQNGPLILGANNTANMTILGNSHVLIGTSTDNGYNLYVNGTAYITGLIEANTYYANGSPGVSCSGSPTGSFQVTGGIVTHC